MKQTPGLHIDQTPVAASMRAKLGLMRGPVFDTLFLFVPVLLCFGAYFKAFGSIPFGRAHPFDGIELAWLVLIYSSYFSTGHAMSTFSRVVWNKQSLKKYHWLLILSPLVIAAALYGIVDSLGVAFLMTTYFILQWFHYVRQGYGLSQVYKHINKPEDPAWLHQAVIYGLPLWGLLHRMTTADMRYLFNDIYTLPALGILVKPIAAISIALIAYWLYRRVVDVIEGRPTFGYTAFVLSHLLVFYFAFIYIEDATIGWIGSAFWHATQYLFFVWHFNRRQVDGEGKFTNYFQYVAISAIVFVPGFMFFGHYMTQGWNWLQANLDLAAATMVAFNLAFLYNHYLADAILWRRQKPKIVKD